MSPLHSSAPSPASPSRTGISPSRWKDRVQWVILCVTSLLPSDLSPALRAIHVVAIRCGLVALNSSRYGFAFLEFVECSFQEHSFTTCLECFSDCSSYSYLSVQHAIKLHTRNRFYFPRLVVHKVCNLVYISCISLIFLLVCCRTRTRLP
ncbi:hypothetical protein B0H16DRAFT_1878476, partial [Mycena metata]